MSRFIGTAAFLATGVVMTGCLQGPPGDCADPAACGDVGDADPAPEPIDEPEFPEPPPVEEPSLCAGASEQIEMHLATDTLVTTEGATETLRVALFGDDDCVIEARDSELTVSSADPGVVAVAVESHSSDGRAPYLVLGAAGMGTTSVRVLYSGTEQTTERTIEVSVVDAEPAEISLSPAAITMHVGTTESAQAVFYNQYGHLLDNLEAPVTVSDPDVVAARRARTIWGDESFIVNITARRTGTATVHINGDSGQVAITALPPQVDRVSLPSSFALRAQCVENVRLLVFDPEQTVLDLVPDYIDVSTSNADVVLPTAYTDSEGYVYGLALEGVSEGMATVRVTAGGVQTAMPVTVEANPGACHDGEEEEEEEEEEEVNIDVGDDEESYFYFSYDDSASTAAVELVKYKLRNGTKPPRSLARAWEFLNYEQFRPEKPEDLGLFNVSMGMTTRPSPTDPNTTEYLLGAYVASPAIDRSARNNVVLTLVVDISGSMSTGVPQVEGPVLSRLAVLRHGLHSMESSLKPGDVINVVSFDSTVQIELEGLEITEDDATRAAYRRAVNSLYTAGSTDLSGGITMGYRLARRHYDPEKLNRIVLLTDAYANVGTVDPVLIADNVEIGEREGMYFSGMGIGDDFQEGFLNVLTEVGKGSYFSLITRNDAARAFTDRFIALLMVAAKNVRFRLDYPGFMSHLVTASEQSSTNPEDVQPTHFSFNTKQYFFETFQAPASTPANQSLFRLTAMYTDPVTGVATTEVIEKTVAELLGRHRDNIREAELIYLFNMRMAGRMSAAEVDAVLATYPPGYASELFDQYMWLLHRYNLLSP